MKNYLKAYEVLFGTALTYSMACIFVTLGLTIVDIIYFVWRKCKGDLEK